MSKKERKDLINYILLTTKHFMRMKRLLTFLTLLTLSIGVVWATETTLDLSDSNTYTVVASGTSSSGSTTTITSGDITVTSDKGYLDNSNHHIRIYSGGKLTISSSSGNITKVVITCTAQNSSNYGPGKLKCDIEANYTYSGYDGTWTGNASSVTLNATAQVRFTKIVVTYTGGQQEPDPTTPNGTITFTPAAGEVTAGTTVAMSFSGTCDGIKYTLDGTSPSATNGIVYDASNPPTINAATTITAAAYNYSNSQYAFGTEATAAYTVYEPTVEYDGVATFVAGTDMGSTTDQTADSMTKDPVSFSSTSAALGRTDNYRLYQNSTNTFSVPTGYKIVKIVFTSANGTQNLLSVLDNVGTYNTTTGIWTGEAQTVSFKPSAQARFEQIDVYYTAPASTGPEYYLAGDFNSWTQNASYKFVESNGSYVLNDVNLPDGQEFKIIKVDNGTTWYGGNGGGSHYGIHAGHHDNIPIGGSDNFYIQVGGVTDFSFTVNNDVPSVLTVSRDAQLYISGDINSWGKTAITASADGWTMNADFAATNQFGFYDEWGTWYGGNGFWIRSQHLGTDLTIQSSGNFYMVDAGNYNLVVNTALTTLVVTSTAGDEYTLVTNAGELNANDEVIIVSKENAYAMSTEQKTSNRGATAITIKDSGATAVANSDTQVFTLEAGTGGWYFNTGSGYIYAASSSNNQLKTETTKDDNALAALTIDSSTGATEFIFQGTNNHNELRYNHNNGSPLFNCYASSSTTGTSVYLYRKAGNKSAMPEISPEGGNIVGFSQEVTITQANGGAIYYTTDGTTPDENSTQYNGAFFTPTVAQLGDEVTVTAVAKEDGKELSNPVSVTYTFVAPVKPTFTPAPGTYPVAQSVSMSTTTTGADVYYTTNSELSYTEIVAQGTKFTQAINVSEETTFYAVAAYYDEHAQRCAVSSITQAKYKFAEVEYEDLDYIHTFTGGTGFGLFTTNDVNNPDEVTVWTVSDDYGAKGTSFTQNPNTNHIATSWLLSPYVSLDDAVEPVLTFDHQINKYFANPSTQATVWIRTYGGEWTQLETSLPTSSTGLSGWTSYDEEYDLSAYNGQLVQIGFKYDNQSTTSGAGTWEIQNFKLRETYTPPIEVENIAEYLALPIGTSNIIFKNPVVVQYHYISGTNKSYIYVKDDSGCAYFHQPAVDGQAAFAQLENGDVIGARFSGDKDYDEAINQVSEFAMFTNLKNFAPTGEKALADPEHETVAHIADATTGVALNNHYITIKKVKLSNLYEALSYGGAKYFDIDDEAHIGYNKFNIDWSVVDDLDAYYNITGIQTAYNNVMEFHPTEIVKWEESVVTLRQLCDEGVTTAGENEYTISNNLMCVFAKDNSIWVKDDTGQSIWPATPADGDLNFEVYAQAAEGIDANTRLNQAYYDQSNWCEIKLTAGVDASQFEGKIIKGGTIHGNFTDKTNPTLENVTLTSAAISSEGDYALNYYMPANFYGSQECFNPNHSTDYGQNYFFMTPKPQEYAQIVWAVWNASSTSMIMSTDDNKNGHRFAGEFEIDLSMNDGASSYSDIESGATYNFTAIIKRTNSKAEGYKVYPLDLNGSNPATGINTVETGKGEVKSIKYVNVAGIVSDKPFQGINIVVTEYTDGTRTTTKMLRK